MRIYNFRDLEKIAYERLRKTVMNKMKRMKKASKKNISKLLKDLKRLDKKKWKMEAEITIKETNLQAQRDLYQKLILTESELKEG